MIRNHHYLVVRIWVKDFPNMEKPKQVNEGPNVCFFSYEIAVQESAISLLSSATTAHDC